MDHADYVKLNAQLNAQLSAYHQKAMKRAADWINEHVEGVTVDNTLTDPDAYCLPIPREISVEGGVFRVRLTSNSSVRSTSNSSVYNVKIVDLPASLLDGIDLAPQEAEPAAEQETEFKARELTDKLRPAGFDVLVQQTGGGTATIYATRGGLTVVGGPGAFNWSDPEESVFDSSDFYVGTEDSEDGGKAVEAGASMEAVAALFTAAAGAS